MGAWLAGLVMGYGAAAVFHAGVAQPAPLTLAAGPAPMTEGEIATLDPKLAGDIGHMALGGGDPGLATKLYERALAQERPDPEVLVAYSLALRRTGRAEKSAEILHQALLLYPDNPRVRYHAGLTALHAGEENLAREHLEAFVRLAPDDTAAASARAAIAAIRRKRGG